jgi:hypothetical protein
MNPTTLFFCVPDSQSNFFFFKPQLALESLLNGRFDSAAGSLNFDASGWLNGFFLRDSARAYGRGEFTSSTNFTVLRLVLPHALRERLVWDGMLRGAGDRVQSVKINRAGLTEVIAAYGRGEVEVLIDTGLLSGQRRDFDDFLGAGPTGFGGC